MESCPLLDDGAAELATSAGSCSTPATTAGPSTATGMRELQEMLENGVLWEALYLRIDGRFTCSCLPVC